MCYSHFGNGDRNGAISITQTVIGFFKCEGAGTNSSAGTTHYKFVWDVGAGITAH